MVNIKGARTKSELYMKLKSIYFNMMQRCYKEYATKYEYYGGRGVTVCEKWQTFDGFIDTVDTVEGWDEGKFLRGELQLDKDTKIKGNKIYSPETCIFIPSRLNKLAANKQRMRPSIAIDPNGNKHKFLNRKEFCLAHDLDDAVVYRCLIGERTHHKLWKFYYEDGSTPKREGHSSSDLKYGISPSGDYHEFRSTIEFGKEHNLNPKGIQAAVRGAAKTYKKWVFGYK
jgi:hypothetical protein